MAGKIPSAFIDDLLARVNVVDVINQYVPLKKAGSEYKACCPFHDEKTPSFTVSPSKQFYHCFGCGAHGTAIGFLMAYEHLSFPEAIETLAESVGLEVPREAGISPLPDHRDLYALLEQAGRYFQQQLQQHPYAQNYLHRRGLSPTTWAKYRIGFAPPGWNNLLQRFGQAPKQRQLLQQAGLIAQKQGRFYDRFRERIVFPILDSRGRIIGFGGRILDQGEPKYLNSPETPIFHKGKALYGLYQAQKSLQKHDFIIVVEGYMDVTALAEHDIPNAVATLGTATTSDHVKMLFRYSHDVIYCFDGDRAGRDAAWKALLATLPLMHDGRQVRFLFLDEGEDPDTQVHKQGRAAFLQALQTAMPLSRFLLNKLSEGLDLGSLEGRARLAKLITPHLAQLPGGAFKQMLQEQVQTLTGIAPNPHHTKQHRPQSPSRWQTAPLSPLHRAIALLLQYPRLAQLPNLPSRWQNQPDTGHRILAQLLESLRANPHLHAAALVEHWRNEEKIHHYLLHLANIELMVLGDEEAQFIGCLKKLDEAALQQSIQALRNKKRPSEMTEEEKNRLRALYSKKSGK